jgi:hypothetical protein
MRAFIIAIAIAIVGFFATAVWAADDTSPIVGKFPDNANNFQVYLFQLKKNGISIKRTPKQFCNEMGYGEVVFSNETEEVEDHKVVPGIDWVICRFKNR